MNLAWIWTQIWPRSSSTDTMPQHGVLNRDLLLLRFDQGDVSEPDLKWSLRRQHWKPLYIAWHEDVAASQRYQLWVRIPPVSPAFGGVGDQFGYVGQFRFSAANQQVIHVSRTSWVKHGVCSVATECWWVWSFNFISQPFAHSRSYLFRGNHTCLELMSNCCDLDL